jgi:oxygen-independent coproporphyrinogen III oxidase
VNVDLMFAIPGQSLDIWRQTLETTASLLPDSVSAYNLNYEEDTEFFEKLQAGEFRDDADQGADFFLQAVDSLAAAGMEPYEVSNYAVPGRESLHNQSYWAGADYLGLGPGAFSTVHGRRWKNVPDTALYITLAGTAADLEREVEAITPLMWRQERITLLLRTRQGVPTAVLGDGWEEKGELLITEGLAHPVGADQRLRLTPRGRLVADSAALLFLGE